MQITFDPLNENERNFVAQFVMEVNAEMTRMREESPAAVGAEVVATIAEADQPDTGADAPSAAPLDPFLQGVELLDAPLPAAADLFGTAPVAPPAGEPSAPIVPPPPVPSAPPAAAPSASVLPVIPAGDVDKHGLPWDERIHSGTRVKNADGSWRQRRGVDAELVKTVENELRALMALPTRPGITLGSADFLDAAGAMAPEPSSSNATTSPAPTAPPAPPVPAPAVAPTPPAPVASAPIASAPAGAAEPGNVPPPPVPAPPTSAPATAPIPSPPVPPAPTAAEPAAPLTFATMLRKVTDALAQNKIKETDVHAALEKIGLLPTQIGLLSARADLLPAFDMHIAAAIGAGHA